MTLNHTAAWAAVVSLTAHLALLWWMPALLGARPAAPLPTAPRVLHAVLLPPPAKPQPSVPTSKSSASTYRTTARASDPATANRPTSLQSHWAPTAVQTPVADRQTTHTGSHAAPATAEPAPLQPEPRPLNQDLPRPAQPTGSRGVAATERWRSTAAHGPVATEATAAEQAAASPLTPLGATISGTTSIREQRGDTLSQADVRTPWGRYCMRQRKSSRMTELHDSPFGQGMQATTCDRD